MKNSALRKQNKNISQNKKSSLKTWKQVDLDILNERRSVTFESKAHRYVNSTNNTRPQETLEIKMKKQLETFCFLPPNNLVEEGKWLLAVSSFQCTKSVFNVAVENDNFSINKPGHWENESAEKSVDELKKLLEL